MEPIYDTGQITLPLLPSFGWLAVEYTCLLIILVSMVILHKNSERPGTLGMLIGLSVYFLCSVLTLPLLFQNDRIIEFYGQFLHYWPSITLASFIVISIGLFRFSLSFKNES